jgi:hypothetical protein
MNPQYSRIRTGDFDEVLEDDGGSAKNHSQPKSTNGILGGMGIGRAKPTFSTGHRQQPPDLGNNHADSILQLKMREQDANLDALGSSVLRLGDMSLNISKEIELQNRMLDSLEAETDIARDKVDILTKKTKEIIKRSGGVHNFCLIVFLVCVLIILTLLVIYT